MSDASKRKEKQLLWVIQKPKIENASILRGIFFIDPQKFRCQSTCLATFNLRSTGKLVEWKRIESQQSGAQIYSNASSIENTRCKGSSEERMVKTRKNTAMAADESQNQN